MQCNIQKFDQLVAQIFAELYATFPVRSHVKIYSLFGCKEKGYYNERGIWVEPADLSKSDQQLYCDTIKWLIDTGYIIGTIRDHHNSSITLSMKGLQLLKSVPKSVESSQSLGDQLLSVLKSGSKDVAANLINSALSYDNIITQIGNLFSTTQ